MEPYTIRCSRREAIQRGLIVAGGLGSVSLAARPGRTLAAAASQPGGPSAAANLSFGFRLHAALSGQAAGRNLLFSPLSISVALGMAYLGARGSTQTAMARALSVGGMQPQDVGRGTAALLTGLGKIDPAIDLHIADSIWRQAGLITVPTFEQALKTYYSAEAASVDFKDPRTPGVINAWVNKQTRGLIPAILGAIDPKTVLILINALYFEARWSSQFSASSTRPGPFTLANGQTVTVPMMSHAGSYRYIHTPDYEAISLPYESGKVAMYVFLPAKGSSLARFQAGLDARTWATRMQGLTTRYGSISLPRFRVDYKTKLNSALAALGMGVAFDSRQANFSGMIENQPAFITEVLHRAVMEVNEQGTKAAAATSVGIGITAIQAPSFSMVVDRPFFCAIRDETTGVLLFMGSIVDPR